MPRYTLQNKTCIICFSGYEKSSATERYEYKSREKGTREGLEKDIKNLDILFYSISIQFHFVYEILNAFQISLTQILRMS